MIASTMWLIPVGSMSRLIFSTTSAGVPGDREPVGKLGCRELERGRDVAPAERLDDGRKTVRVEPVALDLLARHRGDVESDDRAGGLLGGLGIRRDDADAPGADVE